MTGGGSIPDTPPEPTMDVGRSRRGSGPRTCSPSPPALHRSRPLRLGAAAWPLLLAGCALGPGRDTPSWSAAFPDADTTVVDELAPGVRHVRLRIPAGPWAVHVVEIDEAVCRPRLEARKAGPPLAARATTTRLADGALAAVNADFFMIPGGTPVGAHVRDGRVVVGPGLRPVFARDTRGRSRAGSADLAGFVAVAGDTARIGQVNRPRAGGRHHPPRPGITIFDHWFGAELPGDSAAASLRVRRLPGTGRAPGDLAAGVVVETVPPGGAVSLDGRQLALRAMGHQATAWLSRRAPGDTIAWRAAVTVDGAAAAQAVGGFPVLLAGGRGVVAAQEGVIASFGEARHPRTAVGWDAPGDRLFLVVVDGRQPGYSAGMTLAELEWLLLRLGATDAINLDGGGSTALVVDGRAVNRPSDTAGERPVGNALVLAGCGPGRGAPN